MSQTTVTLFEQFLKEYYLNDEQTCEKLCTSDAFPSLAQYFFTEPFNKTGRTRCLSLEDLSTFAFGNGFKRVFKGKFKNVVEDDLKLSLDEFIKLNKEEQQQDLIDTADNPIPQVASNESELIKSQLIDSNSGDGPLCASTKSIPISNAVATNSESYVTIEKFNEHLLSFGNLQHSITRLTKPIPPEAAEAQAYLIRARKFATWIPQLDIDSLNSTDKETLAKPVKITERMLSNGKSRKCDPNNLMWIVYDQELLEAGQDSKSGHELRDLLVSVFGGDLFQKYSSLTDLRKGHPFRRAVEQITYMLARSKAICEAKVATNKLKNDHPGIPEDALKTLEKAKIDSLLPMHKSTTWKRTIRLWQNEKESEKKKQLKQQQEVQLEKEKERKKKRKDKLKAAYARIAELEANNTNLIN